MLVPGPVKRELVFQPVDPRLLGCALAPAEAPLTDDLDGGGIFNQTRDAWEDCWKRNACIAKIYAGQPCRFEDLGLPEEP